MAIKLKPPALESLEEEEYNPARLLDIPTFGDEDRYVYRWIRFRAGSEDDYNNVGARMRQGWVFVKLDEVPEGYVFPAIGSKIEHLQNCVVNGDLVLAKLPRSKAKAMQKWAEDQANNAEAGFNSRLIRYEDGGNVHTFDNQGSRTVTRGVRPSFA
jgi:hypothetical protein